MLKTTVKITWKNQLIPDFLPYKVFWPEYSPLVSFRKRLYCSKFRWFSSRTWSAAYIPPTSQRKEPWKQCEVIYWRDPMRVWSPSAGQQAIMNGIALKPYPSVTEDHWFCTGLSFFTSIMLNRNLKYTFLSATPFSTPWVWCSSRTIRVLIKQYNKFKINWKQSSNSIETEKKSCVILVRRGP